MKSSRVIVVLVTFFWAQGFAQAFDPGVVDNLKRTRDSLLDQRQNLQQAYDQTSQQVQTLQHRLDNINGYLNANDRALRDIDQALQKFN